jgi:hypothetical protein
MSILHYAVVPELGPLVGEPIYVSGDHAFNFRPADSDAVGERAGQLGTTSVVLDTLQLEVGVETGQCLWVWGYSPVTGWAKRTLLVPSVEPGGVRCSTGAGLQRGVSMAAIDGAYRYFDPSSGWFCTAATDTWLDLGARALEIATGTILLLTDDDLMAVFVRPANWQELSPLFGAEASSPGKE